MEEAVNKQWIPVTQKSFLLPEIVTISLSLLKFSIFEKIAEYIYQGITQTFGTVSVSRVPPYLLQ